MKIRLEGTKEEIDWAIQSLRKNYSVSGDYKKLYQSRDGSYRCYLDLTPYFVRGGWTSEPKPSPTDAVLGGRDL